MNRVCAPISRLSPDDGFHYWVGYYDKQPWSSDGARVLCHRAPFCDRFPVPGEACEVGTLVREGRGYRFERAGQTRAWNWQQGAQLRWHEAEGQEAMLFNDFNDDGQPVSRWVSANGQDIRRVLGHLYAITPDGSCGLTLSYGRLSRLRPEYGYPAISDERAALPAPDDDGVWRVDLATGGRELLVSMAGVAEFASGVDLTSPGAPHQHVNHIMVNPSGTRFCFLHRYERADGIMQSRLFTAGIDGSGLRLLMEGMVSHYDWADDGRILAWGGRRKLLGGGGSQQDRSMAAAVMTVARRALKPVYYAMGKPRFLMNKIVGDSYLMIPDAEGGEPAAFAKGELTCDGHNTFFRGGKSPGRWMVTDGYPDLKSRQPLYVWDMERNEGYEIGRFSTPRELDGDVRVDLHPRFSRDGRSVCIDSAMGGRRAVYHLDVHPMTGQSENQL